MTKREAVDFILGGLTEKEFLDETITNFKDQHDILYMIKNIYKSRGTCGTCALFGSSSCPFDVTAEMFPTDYCSRYVPQ